MEFWPEEADEAEYSEPTTTVLCWEGLRCVSFRGIVLAFLTQLPSPYNMIKCGFQDIMIDVHNMWVCGTNGFNKLLEVSRLELLVQ